ncbi:hypothetical protein LINPERHAP1_LOCUS18219, partial [Linum perenne]
QITLLLLFQGRKHPKEGNFPQITPCLLCFQSKITTQKKKKIEKSQKRKSRSSSTAAEITEQGGEEAIKLNSGIHSSPHPTKVYKQPK